MRVVCPWTQLHERTRASLALYAPQAEMVELGTDLDCYWELLAQLWEVGEAFCVVEHDIEVGPETLQEFAVCPEWWCVAPYNGARSLVPPHERTLLRRSLGCARFDAELLATHPGIMQQVGQIDDAYPPIVRRDYRRLDARLSSVLEGLEFEAHQHAPVLHHHVYEDGQCACEGHHG